MTNQTPSENECLNIIGKLQKEHSLISRRIRLHQIFVEAMGLREDEAPDLEQYARSWDLFVRALGLDKGLAGSNPYRASGYPEFRRLVTDASPETN